MFDLEDPANSDAYEADATALAGERKSEALKRDERRVGMEELCHRLNIKSRSTIYAHIKAGLIQKPSRLGRSIGWPSSYVDGLVRKE